MSPKYPAPVLPSRLDDRQSLFDTRAFALPLVETMRCIARTVHGWDVERDAIRSVVRDHAIVELDVSRWTTLTVRIEAAEAPDGRTTGVCGAITVQATTSALAVGVVLVNTLVGIPFAVMARRRERARAFAVGRTLIEAVFADLEGAAPAERSPES